MPMRASPPFFEHPDIVFRAAGFFVEAHKPIDALHLADELRARNDPDLNAAADFFYTVVLAQARSLSPLDKQEVKSFLETRVGDSEERANAFEARMSRYNLGDWEASQGNWGEAFIHFCKAAEWDPAYLERGYFCAALGTVLFELGCYENSAEFYWHARRLGEEELTVARLADALMYAGQYTEAMQAFRDFFIDPPDNLPAIWALKAWGLFRIASVLNLQDGERRSDEANQVCESLKGISNDEQVLERLQRALSSDPLHGNAWFNFGVAARKLDQTEMSLLGFVMTGLSGLGDAEAWCNATLISLDDETFHPLFEPIVQTACLGGEQLFIDRLVKFVTVEQLAGFPSTEVLKAVEEAIRHMRQDSGGFTIRFLMDGAHYESLTVERPDPE